MKKLILNIFLLLMVWVFYSGCSSISQIDLIGTWGGEHIGMVVSDSSTPIRIDETPDEHPALYKGHIVGNEMTLILVITDTNTEIDTFSLTRGVEPLIYKCL